MNISLPSDGSSQTLYHLSLQAKERLQDLQQRPSGLSEVVVVGGGYAGIELATTAVEMLAGLCLVFLRCAACVREC